MLKNLKEMTNLEYAKTLDRAELPLIIKVARAYIEKIVGSEAPLYVKELAYNHWCNSAYDNNGWARARLERAGKVITV